jgi:hypothetical protein
MPGFSKRLVIDACVARASGGEAAIHPTSKQCRDFLKVVLEISHRVVVTPDIRTEWDKHQSKFARLWLVTMGRKGKIVYANIDADRELRSKMETYAENSGLSVKEILKDLHLLEAAFGTDEVIVSYENYSRKHYANAARGEVPEIARVSWVSPCNEAEEPLTWLKSGARAEEHRRLGS